MIDTDIICDMKAQQKKRKQNQKNTEWGLAYNCDVGEPV